MLSQETSATWYSLGFIGTPLDHWSVKSHTSGLDFSSILIKQQKANHSLGPGHWMIGLSCTNVLLHVSYRPTTHSSSFVCFMIAVYWRTSWGRRDVHVRWPQIGSPIEIGISIVLIHDRSRLYYNNRFKA